jgi:hypothetical protein
VNRLRAFVRKYGPYDPSEARELLRDYRIVYPSTKYREVDIERLMPALLAPPPDPALPPRTTGATARTLGLPTARAYVLRAVVTQDRPTIRSVALASGLTYGSAYRQLLILRHQGFVKWARDGRGNSIPGTLRATVSAHRPDEALAQRVAGYYPRGTTTPDDKDHAP